MVTTDGGGNATFTTSFAGSYPFIAATATDAAGNTSEFSPDLIVQTNRFAVALDMPIDERFR